MFIRLGIAVSFFSQKVLLKHATDMKKQSFIFFTITYELNNFINADYLLNSYINHDYDQWMERNFLPSIKILLLFTTFFLLLYYFADTLYIYAHPSSALARLRRVQIFKLFSYAESDIWIQFK